MGSDTCDHGTLGLRKKGRPLALKAGGQAGPLFQLDSRGSGNAIQFPDVSSHIPAPSKPHTRENTYFGPVGFAHWKTTLWSPHGLCVS